MNINELRKLSLKLCKLFEIKNQNSEDFGVIFVAIAGDKLIPLKAEGLHNFQDNIIFKETCCALLSAYSANACILLSEAWILPPSVTASLSPSELDYIKRNGIADHPDCKEILSLYMENRSDKALTDIGIVRNPDGKIFSFDESNSCINIDEEGELSGLFTHFFKPLKYKHLSEILRHQILGIFDKHIFTIEELSRKIERQMN